MRHSVQFNTINVIFVKGCNQFYSLGGSWCQKLKINRLRYSVEHYYSAKFQVNLI